MKKEIYAVLAITLLLFFGVGYYIDCLFFDGRLPEVLAKRYDNWRLPANKTYDQLRAEYRLQRGDLGAAQRCYERALEHGPAEAWRNEFHADFALRSPDAATHLRAASPAYRSQKTDTEFYVRFCRLWPWLDPAYQAANRAAQSFWQIVLPGAEAVYLEIDRLARSVWSAVV